MRKYYLITDVVNNKDYLIWQFDNTNILGYVIGFAKNQNVRVEDLRLYSFRTKTEWNKYGCDNFHRIKWWQATDNR